MSEIKTAIKGDLQVYACGGAGINISSIFEEFRGVADKGMAVVDLTYLDTSRSNLRPEMKEENVFILSDVVENVDGSGKDRTANSEAIQRHMGAILQKHRPGYVNVVVTSLSGGSGSVIAPVLVHNLLKEGKMVIVIAIGVAKTGKEIGNTMATLQSFERVSTINKKPVVMAYFENCKETPPSAVDSSVAEMITAISVLFSRENNGLDTKDMYNFLNFNDKVTSYPAHLAQLTTTSGEITDGTGVISVATAAIDNDNIGVEFVAPYGCYGILPREVASSVADRAPLHLIVKAYAFNGIAARLNELLEEIKREAAARVAESSLVTKPASDDEILVF